MTVAAVRASNSSGICGTQTDAEPGLLRPAGVGHEPLDLRLVPAALGANHHADAHAPGLPVTGENVLLALE